MGVVEKLLQLPKVKRPKLGPFGDDHEGIGAGSDIVRIVSVLDVRHHLARRIHAGRIVGSDLRACIEKCLQDI